MGNLTGKDIVAIIQAGAKASVYTLELGELKIKYGKAADHAPEPTQLTLPAFISQDNAPTNYINELDEELLNVTDPVAYEEIVAGVKHNAQT